VTPRPYRRRAGGFAYIAAIVLLIVVAGMATAMVRLTASQQNTALTAALTARAGQAARGGVEWMYYKLANNGTAGCPGSAAPTTLTDFKADTGLLVTVTCTYYTYFEGQDPTSGLAISKNIFRVEAVACNGTAASCPDNASATSPDYTERRRVSLVCMLNDKSDCY